MENIDRLKLIKNLKKELEDLAEAKKKINKIEKQKREELEIITNNLVNELLKQEENKQ